MAPMLWVLLVCAFAAFMYLKSGKSKITNLPGPRGLPFFGVLFQLESHFHVNLFKWSQQYGKLFSLNILSDHMVSINDAKLAKELLSLDKLTGRPAFDPFLLYEGEKLGVANSQGELWETHRRFTLRQLRDFGFGKNSMELLIMEEVHELVDRLKAREGSPVGQIKDQFTLAVVNSLWQIVSGRRFSQDDPKLRALTASLNKVTVESANAGGLIFFLPFLKHIVPGYLGYTAARDGFEQLKVFVLEAVAEHQQTFQPDTCRDFIDVYLKEMHSVSDPKSTFYGPAAEKQLTAVVADLFFAGSDTTSTSLAWAVLYLATNQAAQRKLHAEITSITGGSRNVSVADRPNMPYLQATIDEVLRLSSILPSGVEHSVLTDFEFQGVFYPKGTMVMLNSYFIHHNPEIWTEPESFSPERFLSGGGEDDGKRSYKKSENVLPFSTGKRVCLGETLARDSLFLFISNLFQHFAVTVDPAHPNPSFAPGPGFILNPQDYSVIFKARNEE